MSYMYFTQDETVDGRKLPSISLEAETFHRYNRAMTSKLHKMVTQFRDPNLERRGLMRPAEWRFQRHKVE